MRRILETHFNNIEIGKVNTTTDNSIIHIYSNEHLSEGVNKNCALQS